MQQTKEEMTPPLAERLCWEVACRDDGRVARRLYRKQLVDGVYGLAEGALLDDFLHFLQAIGVMTRLEEAHGAAIHRQMIPFVQDCPALRREDPVWDGEHECPAPLAVQ